MEKPRDKVFYRKDSQTNILYNRKDRERPRPRSRSVYTSKSHNSDNSGSLRDSKSYEGVVPWLSRSISNKNIFIDDYNVCSVMIVMFRVFFKVGICCSMIYIMRTPLICVSPLGVITLRLHDRVRVDISLDRAVRIINARSGIVIALSASGSSAALMHPNGRVYQYGSRVEILAHDPHGNNKYAKMWYKGVSFTSDQCALVYLVDSAGTRTTTDTFSDLNVDFSISVFCSESPYGDGNVGQNLINEAVNLLQSSTYWVSDDGTSNWLINNVRVSQTTDGLVRVGRNSNKFSLHTSPSNGSARISSPFLHCTGSMGQTRHLFVRRGERRMHYDGASFIVRNAGHSAGFDDKHQLKVY
ncbi:PREDICTED: LOW QUALITY PROTEIN: uncharacterized protein LOC108562686 [Nicrophorus vespilloides]|uniref:LOW QUALITY PROTEIN: uncharacterized protein LOC108562686 n=1 Tax=Nicrophorus vespilloides TaxID=110193 RepID=A0ABM1MPU1_NICVS|nr:PREDICTED: LOW QUALITY PROTEIN: uncharacterized protein LOC108562686 [Nicrophorus vespilloides]